MPELTSAFANKAGQSGVDILVIIVMAIAVIMFLTSGWNLHSLDTTSMRYKSVAIAQDKNVLLNMRDDSVFKNATLTEIVSMHYCGYNNKQQLDSLFSTYLDVLGDGNYDYIAMICPNGNCTSSKTLVFCNPDVEARFGRCCVKLESVTVTKSYLKLDTQDGCIFDGIQFVLGRWPMNESVEACS